jgi:hypothetical protein
VIHGKTGTGGFPNMTLTPNTNQDSAITFQTEKTQPDAFYFHRMVRLFLPVLFFHEPLISHAADNKALIME